MVRPIQYEDYDKISDDVLYLGSKLYLRMNVSLSTKTDQDQRYHFHKEFRYNTNNGKLMSIKRSFNYFLSLDKTDMRVNIMIRPSDMIILRRELEKVSSWFNDDTFGLKDKRELVIRRKTKPSIIDGLANNKYIQFDPIVVIWENTNEQSPGVRITLGDPSVFADITVDRFNGLYYTIMNFNMYMSAQLLINYLARPEFGTNLYSIEDNSFIMPSNNDKMEGAKTNRSIPNKPKSFFEGANKMMDS